jgi:hypothetical protein
MDGLPRGFVHDQYILIFVDHGEGNRSRADIHGTPGIHHPGLENVAGLKFIAHEFVNAVHKDGGLVRLHGGQNVPGVFFSTEKFVDVLPGVLFFDFVSEYSFHIYQFILSFVSVS